MNTRDWERLTIFYLIGSSLYVLGCFFADKAQGLQFAFLSAPILFTIYRLLCRKVYLGAVLLCMNFILLAYLIVLSISDPSNLSFGGMILRSTVFQEDLISKSLCSLYLFCAVMAIHLIISAPHNWILPEPTKDEIHFLAKAVTIALYVSFILHLITVRAPLITTAAYHSDKYLRLRGAAYSQGLILQLIAAGLLAFSMASSVIVFGWKNRLTKISLLMSFFIVIYFYLMRGNRGVVLGMGILFSILILLTARNRLSILKVIGFFMFLYLLLRVWGTVRWEAEEMGIVNAFVLGCRKLYESLASNKDFLVMGHLAQLSWNLLDVVNLYDLGIRRCGETYVNLILQSIPKFISGVVNYERPMSEPWMLARYVDHGGAINPVAEAYWNFGIYGVMATASVLSIIIVKLERYFRKKHLSFYPIYFSAILLLPGSYVAGTQAFVRILEAIVLLILAYSIVLRVWVSESIGEKVNTINNEERGLTATKQSGMYLTRLITPLTRKFIRS